MISKPIVLDETAQKIDATLQEIKRAILPNLTYATKVVGGTSGNLASLTDDGNISDSGKKASDFADAGDLVNLSDEVGINLWDEEWEAGYWSDSTGEKMPSSNWGRCKNHIKVNPNTKYYFYFDISSGSGSFGQFIFYDGNKNILGVTGSYTFTTPENAEYITFYMSINRIQNKHCINIFNPAINGNYYPFRGLRKDIQQLSANLGDAWNSSTTYKVGDYCIYSNALYKCKTQNSNTVPTNATYWTRVKVADELGTINRDLAELDLGTYNVMCTIGTEMQGAYYRGGINFANKTLTKSVVVNSITNPGVGAIDLEDFVTINDNDILTFNTTKVAHKGKTLKFNITVSTL